MARSRFRPTATQRKEVRSLAMIGVSSEEIAEYVGVRSVKTVERHFRKELARGRAEAMSAVMEGAFRMAESGKYPVMSMFWMNTVGSGVPRPSTKPGKFRLEAIRAEPPAGQEHEYRQRRDGMWVSVQEY